MDQNKIGGIEMEYTKYAAIGHFKCHYCLNGRKYPVVIVNQKEYLLDVQEMTVWSCLAWRILSRQQIIEAYIKLSRGLSFTSSRTLSDCIDRLITRGLIAEGRGSSEYDALYDLLSCLYIAPVSVNPFLRIGVFLKMWLLDGTDFSTALRLFSRPKCSAEEKQIVRLTNKALLSGAELIKCADRGVQTISSEEQLMAHLYDDELSTCENLPILMAASRKARPVSTAIANLYLKKQIIFERC